MLHPEVEWCKHCGHQKLSSAETTLGNFIQAILNTWEGDSTEEIGDLVVTTIEVEDIREMVWHPHGRYNSGLLERAWNDARGQSVLEHGMELAQVYPPMNCFCSDFHTEESFYYVDANYINKVTRERIVPLCELEGYPLNFVRNPNPLFDDDAAERSDFDEWYLNTHNQSNIYPISECVFQSPIMAQNQNLVVAPGEGHSEGGLADQDDRDMAVDPVEGNSPYNESKSLITGKEGFSPFFKSKAQDKLGTH